MIEIEGLSFRYRGGDRPALKSIDLKVEDGEFVVVAGASKSGKTTLLRCINGLIPHFYGGVMEGRVRVQGLDTRVTPPSRLALKVGMVFQDPENQMVTTEVSSEVAFGLENMALPRDVMGRRIVEALDAVEAQHLRHRRIHELSGGEKQKIALASVLALQPEIIILDEPTSELDPASAEGILHTLERLNSELGLTVILVEQRLERVLSYADRLIAMREGEIMGDGHPRKILGELESSNLDFRVPPVSALTKLMGLPVALTVKEARLSMGRAGVKPRGSPASGGSPRDTADRLRRVAFLEDVYYSYPGGVPALRGVSMTVYEGELLAVMGRTGCGKTTLLKHLNGLLKPVRGRVVVNGLDTREVDDKALAGISGYLFQNPNLHLLSDTVEEEIILTLRSRGFKGEDLRKGLEEALERFGITHLRTRYPRYLSGGERQWVAFASVAAGDPKLLLLDEPTRGMDEPLKSRLIRYIREFTARGGAVVMATHDVELVAWAADRVVLLSDGEVVASGDKRKVLAKAMFFSPQMNRLFASLSDEGFPPDVLTLDEALRVLS
ncbi:MAG: ATP-binding cassette domain-containing protein [Candidatus Bathyarchaeia archaeon]